nr:undecaprenyl-phosphate glucose phosphotransferase [Devosia sp. MC1541]
MFQIDTQSVLQNQVSQRAPSDGTLSPRAEELISEPADVGYSSAVITGIAQIVEAILLITIGCAIYWSYVGTGQENFYLPVISASGLVANLFFNIARTHRIRAYRSRFWQLGRVLAGWSSVIAILAIGFFFFKAGDQVSRVWLMSWWALGGITLVVYRLSLRSLVQHWSDAGQLKRRTVIVGGGQDAAQLINQIQTSAKSDIELIGLFDDRVDDRSPDEVSGFYKLGRVSDLVEFARRTRVDLVLVSMPLSAEKRVLDMLTQLWVLPVDIRLSAHMSKLRFTNKAYSYVGDLPVLDMADRPISDWNLVFKWAFDKTVALLALIALSPIMLITALAIKLESKGPIFFVQDRHGFNNELIRIYKFRSMRTDMLDANATKLVTKDDPRVTKVGKFIRRTSIDELPQLFNVLKGELSIVGPRPHALQAKAANTLYYEAVEGYFARHKVKPGITGWAQISGWRGETDTLDKIEQRVNHDLYYIENWSILFDLKILVLTPFRLFSSGNAY